MDEAPTYESIKEAVDILRNTPPRPFQPYMTDQDVETALRIGWLPQHAIMSPKAKKKVDEYLKNHEYES